MWNGSERHTVMWNGKGTDNRSGMACHTEFYRPARSIDMDLIYLTIVAVFFLLSGWLISALDRL